jgi:hypothetical protein
MFQNLKWRQIRMRASKETVSTIGQTHINFIFSAVSIGSHGLQYIVIYLHIFCVLESSTFGVPEKPVTKDLSNNG